MKDSCDHAMSYDMGYNECPCCGEHLGGGKVLWLKQWLKPNESLMLDDVLNENDAKVRRMKDCIIDQSTTIKKLEAKVKKLEKIAATIPKFKRTKGARVIEL